MWGCNENVSGGSGMMNAVSVKDRLKKQAIEDGKTMHPSHGSETFILLSVLSVFSLKCPMYFLP